MNGHLLKFQPVYAPPPSSHHQLFDPYCLSSRPGSTRSRSPSTSGGCQRAGRYAIQHCYSPTLQPAEAVVFFFVRKRVAKETRLQPLERVFISSRDKLFMRLSSPRLSAKCFSPNLFRPVASLYIYQYIYVYMYIHCCFLK